MDELLSYRYATKEYVQARIAEAMAYASGGAPAVLGTKTITANGTYTAAADSLDGFSSVDVSVPGPDTTPLLMLTGTITPVSDTTTLYIPIDGISDFFFANILDAGYSPNSTPTGTTNQIYGQSKVYNKALYGTNIGGTASIFATDGSGNYDYWSSGINIQYTASSIKFDNNKSYVFKSGTTYKYIILGVPT